MPDTIIIPTHTLARAPGRVCVVIPTRPQPPEWLTQGREPWEIRPGLWGFAAPGPVRACRSEDTLLCPYQPGVPVLVREGWLTYSHPITDHLLRDGADTWPMRDGEPFEYAADDDGQLMALGWVRRSAAFMRAEHARYAFTPETVRCCRVQEVTEEEAGLAGYEPYGGRVSGPFDPPEYDGGTARDDFASDWWQKYRARPGRRWDDNPSVWVIVGDVERRQGR